MVLQVEGDVELQEDVKAETAKDSGPNTSVSIVMIEFCPISEPQSKPDVGTGSVKLVTIQNQYVIQHIDERDQLSQKFKIVFLLISK